jgi:arsenate reductase
MAPAGWTERRKARLYHNPRCSKSRAALALLRANGIEPEIVEYLETPPDATELERLRALLGLEPRALLRRNEEVYRELKLDDPKLDDRALIRAMAEHPILIERPIIVAGAKAVIGRPPSRALSIL